MVYVVVVVVEDDGEGGVMEEGLGLGCRWLRTEESEGRRGGREEPFLG